MHIIFFIFLPEGSQRIYPVLLLPLSCAKEICLALCSDGKGVWSDGKGLGCQNAFCHLQVGDLDKSFQVCEPRVPYVPMSQPRSL